MPCENVCVRSYFGAIQLPEGALATCVQGHEPIRNPLPDIVVPKPCSVSQKALDLSDLEEDPGVRRTEPPTPLPNRLVGHGDAPLSKKIFDIAEAQTETMVEPNGVTDDFLRNR
jgi:hypothetical protein